MPTRGDAVPAGAGAGAPAWHWGQDQPCTVLAPAGTPQLHRRFHRAIGKFFKKGSHGVIDNPTVCFGYALVGISTFSTVAMELTGPANAMRSSGMQLVFKKGDVFSSADDGYRRPDGELVNAVTSTVPQAPPAHRAWSMRHGRSGQRS